jgi:ABC-type transporter Mla subunit MlaD
MNYREWRQRDTRELLWIIYSRGQRIEGKIQRLINMIQNLTKTEGEEMATLDEFKQSLNDMKTELAHDADVQASAATALHTLADHLTNGAATATDLDELKTLVTGMSSEMHANADSLAAAIADTSGGGNSNPAPAPTSSP